MAKNAGHIIATNWEGEWRFWDHLGWLPLPLWLDHIESVYGGLGQSAVQWIVDHCPDSWKSERQPRAEALAEGE